jgi:hypothetical protein
MSMMYCDCCGELKDSDFVEFIEMQSDYEDLYKGDNICITCSENLPEGAGE